MQGRAGRSLPVSTSLLVALIAVTLEAQAGVTSVSRPFDFDWVHGRCEGCAPRLSLGEIQFVTERDGWASASFLPSEGNGSGTSVLLKTMDGGKRWTEAKPVRQDPSSGSEPLFHFLDRSFGWAAWTDVERADFVIAVTVDGVHWSKRSTPSGGTIRFLHLVDEKKVEVVEVVAGSAPRFETTQDGGKTWRGSNLSIRDLEAASITAKGGGWLAGRSRDGGELVILRPAADGVSWQPIRVPGYTDTSVHSILAESADTAWMVTWLANGGGSRLLHTQDGGQSWNEEKASPFQVPGRLITAGGFIAPMVGIFFCEDVPSLSHHLVWTRDGGATWRDDPFEVMVSHCQRFGTGLRCSAGMDVLNIRLSSQFTD